MVASVACASFCSTLRECITETPSKTDDGLGSINGNNGRDRRQRVMLLTLSVQPLK
jgi:hypothetical protein